MDIAVPSRFACLKIEDDEMRPQSSKPKEVKKKVEKKPVSKKPEKDLKPSDKPGNAKKTSNNKQMVNSSSANKKDKKKQNTQQWEEWKQKDNEFVNGNFEEDLQNAIMLSKLDYEHNKDVYKKLAAAAEKEKAQAQLNKKKKNKSMSLEQFLNSGGDKNNVSTFGSDVTITKLENNSLDNNFFEKIKLDAKKEFNKEQITEKRKRREANIDEIISLAQCQEKLEQERAKSYTLQAEVDKLKEELAAVKGRNKILCGILGHGEMKDKADVLLELERVYTEKKDLAEEVSRLHVLLEQERSKVPTLDTHNNKHKDKKRKQK